MRTFQKSACASPITPRPRRCRQCATARWTSPWCSTPAEAEAPLNIVELESFREILVGGRTFTALASQTLSLKELSAYPLISLSEESMTRAFYRQSLWSTTQC